MIRWLLDTDHVSLQERGHPGLLEHLRTVAPSETAISVITVEEMLRGRLALLARRPSGPARTHAYAKLMETVQFCNKVNVVHFDQECEDCFLELRAKHPTVGSQDLRIAAIAMVHELIVVTRNRKDFGRIPELKMEDWTLPQIP